MTLNTESFEVLMSATSYPRNEGDWQGVFIRKMAEGIAANTQAKISLWSPGGPLPPDVDYACSPAEERWLRQLTDKGGIAHLLREKKFTGILSAFNLLRHLRRAYVRYRRTDLFHVNWLQSALPLYGIRRPTLITVLGSDLKLLKIPGIVTLMRAVIRQRPCIIAPNAQWMVPLLEQMFGDIAQVKAINFGIDSAWYEIGREIECARTKGEEGLTPNTSSSINSATPTEKKIWIVVSRITGNKIGDLFDWGEPIFQNEHELHLLGPNQENLLIPDWVHYHGPCSPEELLQHWFPRATGLITLSKHDEGRPQVMLEAMASGIPIIASAITAHSDFISQESNGLMVGDQRAFKLAVDRLSDASYNIKIGNSARAYAQSQYGTWKDCANRYAACYHQLLQEI